MAVLAFASLEPEVAAAARNWLVASATIKTALGAWAAVVRSTYGGHRLADLGGWARHSPVLGVSFAAILVAAVGLPGIAIWESRAQSVIGSAMPGLGGDCHATDCCDAGDLPRSDRARRDRADRPGGRGRANRAAALERRADRRLVGRLAIGRHPSRTRRGAREPRAAHGARRAAPRRRWPW